MSVRLTPRGTRGSRFHDLPRPVLGLMRRMGILMVRLGGRRARVQGQPLMLLETVGARSGKHRIATLARFADEDASRRSWLVVASALGSPKHPAWYFNLARRPDDAWVIVDGRRIAVRSESLSGDERARAWDRIVRLAPGYGKYSVETDREIPIVRLTPRA